MRLARIPPTNQLQPIDLVAPGFRGLNLMQASNLLSPAYATTLQNAVIDNSGRIAARDGFTNVTTTPISGNHMVRTIFEYKRITGATSNIIAWDGGISTSTTNPDGSDISGAVSDADGDWFFQNFNDKCLGFQAGQKLIVYTGSGNFATVVETSGTAPSGGIGCAAFGRVWQVDSDLQTIKYSGLLNETQWASGGAGSIDMKNVWTHGTDVVTAIVAFNGALIVFGLNHIVVWRDLTGNVLGIDPSNIKVTDVVTGTGCLSQWSVQPVGQTDLLFLSKNGVQSLSRLIIERSQPIETLTKYVRDDLLANAVEQASQVRSTYNPKFGFYLLSFPTYTTVWCLDVRSLYRDQDGDTLAIITTWNSAVWSLCTKQDNTLYLSRTGGKVAQYTGDLDDGATFRFVYASPWLDLGEELANRLKMLKRLGGVLFVKNATSVVFKYSTDFAIPFESQTVVVTGDAAAEYGIAEYGIAEYGGGLSLRIIHVPVRTTGQYFRIGIEADVNGEFSIQQAELFAKIGRVA